MQTLPKFQLFFFISEIDKLFPKFIWKYKEPRTAKKIFSKNNSLRVTFSDFKTY